jgi:micrococcal nuclease
MKLSARSWWFVAIVALTLFISVSCEKPSRRISPLAAEPWRLVTRVVDGDTLVLDGGERVRLIGVDTPESVDPRRPVQCFANQAAAFTRRMVESRRVRLEYGPEKKDRYGRTLAFVYLEDGTFLNALLVREGYGHAYTRFPFKYMDEFRQYERQAREADRGLWGAGCPER